MIAVTFTFGRTTAGVRVDGTSSIKPVRVVVEVGDWEHECCGPAYERDSLVELTCRDVSEPGASAARFVESHHDLGSESGIVRVRGRIADIHIRTPIRQRRRSRGYPAAGRCGGSTRTTTDTSSGPGPASR